MARPHAQDITFPSALPTLRAGADLDIESLREPGEGLYLGLIYAFNVAVLATVAMTTYLAPEVMVIVLV